MTIQDYLKYDCGSKVSLVSDACVRLKKGAGREFKAGGAWIYDNEVEGAFVGQCAGDIKDSVKKEKAPSRENAAQGKSSNKSSNTYPANGSIVSVLDFDGYFLGYGFINLHSKIRVRMLARKQEDVITPAFLYQRVKDAWEYRKAVIDTGACRVIFGEADFLPGLTIDKYNTVLVVESLALGLEAPTCAAPLASDTRMPAVFPAEEEKSDADMPENLPAGSLAIPGANIREIVLAALVQILHQDGIAVTGIYERSDAKVREKEGLARTKRFLSEPFDTQVPILENGIRYLVDVKDGQKTGFFLDQKLNRLAIRPVCAHAAKVLDCFTHTGSFGLNAAMAGAKQVVSIDASELAIAQARENARRNGLEERITYVVGDVFEFLPQQIERGELYDVVILDPPAFTKSRSSVKAAAHGYREINANGLRLVRDGGFLVTCSCSHFMEPEMFRTAIAQAAHDAHKRLRQVEFRQQAPDHPILWANDASYYLKFYILQVVEER